MGKLRPFFKTELLRERGMAVKTTVHWSSTKERGAVTVRAHGECSRNTEVVGSAAAKELLVQDDMAALKKEKWQRYYRIFARDKDYESPKGLRSMMTIVKLGRCPKGVRRTAMKDILERSLQARKRKKELDKASAAVSKRRRMSTKCSSRA